MIPIRINGRGGIGNRIFQYMFGMRLQSMIPGSTVVNVSLPEFGIRTPDMPLPERSLTISNAHQVDMLQIAHLVRSGVYDGVSMSAYVQRLEYYTDREELAKLFPIRNPSRLDPVDPGAIVINVRGNEVLSDVHPDYGPVPVDFFTQVVDETGLTPVIVGQLRDDPYSDEIRRRFSGCDIRASNSPSSDFELVRSASNVVFGVSTFSWLAAWLSPNARRIFMPVSGIFNPAQRPDIDLLPIGDHRYQFYGFPREAWTGSREQLDNLVSREHAFSQLAHDTVSAVRRSAEVAISRNAVESAATELALLRNETDRLRRRVSQLTEQQTPFTEANGLEGDA